MGAIRRNRIERKAKTGIVRYSLHDGTGIFHALARYGVLPSYYLRALDTRHDARNRLTAYHKETADWPQKDLPIIRLQNWRQHGYNSQALYQEGPALIQRLRDDAIYSDFQLSLLRATKIGAQPTNHNIFLNCAVADIEISAKKAGLKFLSHLDLIPETAKDLSFPVEFTHNGEDFKTNLEPDAAFALQYEDGSKRLCFVEYDMGTESSIAQRLSHPSWLRKVLTYKALVKLKPFGAPTFTVLVMYPPQRKHGDIRNAIAKVFPEGTNLFALLPHPPLDNMQLLPHPSDYYFTSDWERVGRDPLNLQKVR